MGYGHIADRIAKDVVALIGGPPVKHKLLDKFIREYNQRKWEHSALFRGKKKVGKRPTSEHQKFLRNLREQIQQTADEIIDIQIKPTLLSISFIGTKGRPDTYAFTPQPFSQVVPGARPVKKKKYVWEIAEEVKQKLREMGLMSLGMRHGKAGEQFAHQKGDARRVAVGKRELLLNSFQAHVRDEYTLKKPDVGWRNRDAVLLSKVNDNILKKAVRWAKDSLPMKEIRERVRQEYLAQKAQGEERPYGFVRG
jgi:hypothetical protein